MAYSSLPELQKVYFHFIGGEWVESASRETFESINPSTGRPLAWFQSGDATDIDRAVSAARKTSPGWARTSVAERSRILNQMADVIDANRETLALMETMDNGKPIRETMNADIPLCADHFRYFAGVIRSEENASADVGDDLVSYNYAEPLGVIGQIIPWNFPLLMAAWKIAPALASGNTVVLKPAEQTPLTVLEFARRVQHLLPPGVLNIVTGFGQSAGAALAAHKGLNKLAFTGSSAVGRLIAMEAAKNMTPVTLELGGKSPNIVFPDANLGKAVEGLVLGACFNQGEVCTCGSRALVHEDIFESVVKQLKTRFERIKVGDPLDPDTMMGAQASQEQFDKIKSYLEYANKNEKLITGGAALAREGYFIQPTVYETTNSSRIAQEEIFGPVLSLIRFKNEDDAVRIANDTSYGLGAGLWTKDINRVYRMTRAIEAGRIWVNNYHTYPAHAPFGGYKQSGIGRETHKMMLSSYRQNKNVLISYDEKETGLFPG